MWRWVQIRVAGKQLPLSRHIDFYDSAFAYIEGNVSFIVRKDIEEVLIKKKIQGRPRQRPRVAKSLRKIIGQWNIPHTAVWLVVFRWIRGQEFYICIVSRASKIRNRICRRTNRKRLDQTQPGLHIYYEIEWPVFLHEHIERGKLVAHVEQDACRKWRRSDPHRTPVKAYFVSTWLNETDKPQVETTAKIPFR